MLAEATMILPLDDNEGKDLLSTVHLELKRELCAKFHGYTSEAVLGGWVDGDGKLYQECSRRYTVAMEDVAESDDQWLYLAMKYGRMAGQKAMYVKLPLGEVRIVSLTPE